MSIHKSLVTKGKLARSRNVLKRSERITELVRAGKWQFEENSPFGLPKVRVMKVKKRGKEKKKDDAEAGKTAAATAETAESKEAKK